MSEPFSPSDQLRMLENAFPELRRQESMMSDDKTPAALHDIRAFFEAFMQQVNLCEFKDHEGHALQRNRAFVNLKAAIEGHSPKADDTKE